MSYATSAEYKTQIKEPGHFPHIACEAHFADARILYLTTADFMANDPLTISQMFSSANKFEIGIASMKQCTGTLNNNSGKFNGYDFTNAVLYPRRGLTLTDTTIEWIDLGIFTIDQPAEVGKTIPFTAVDNMYKFEKSYGTSTLDYPTTIEFVFDDLCTIAGVDWGGTSPSPIGGSLINGNVEGISPGGSMNVEILVVAAGGGSATAVNGPGGAGAGGVVHHASYSILAGNHNYPVVIGSGVSRDNGENSTFSDITAIGGGKSPSGAGGSGGGGKWAKGARGEGTDGQGHGGGLGGGVWSGYNGGGGGGASEDGGDANQIDFTPAYGGVGGDGLAFDISGASTYYGGGGGGNSDGTAGGVGGLGGGGKGDGSDGAGVSGTDNTGGGAGANAQYGGSGIVIIRYLTGFFAATGGDITTDGLYTVHTFNSSGTFISPYAYDNDVGGIDGNCAADDPVIGGCSLNEDFGAFTNSDIIVQSSPALGAYNTIPSCRDLLGMVAMLMGANAYINLVGLLEFKSFYQTLVPYELNTYRSCRIAKNDFSLTGLLYQVTDATIVPYLYGTTTGSVYSIDGNVLLDDTNFDEALLALQQVLCGLVFRPFTCELFPADFSIDGMDTVRLTAEDGTVYLTVISNIVHKHFGGSSISADAESIVVNKFSPSSSAAKMGAVAVNQSIIQITKYDDSVNKLYVGTTAPVVTQPSLWIETAAGVPVSLWLVTV